jgi:xylan 1,4-beta-xylosidase
MPHIQQGANIVKLLPTTTPLATLAILFAAFATAIRADETTLPPLKPLLDSPMRDTSICVGPDGYYMTGTTGDTKTWWTTNAGEIRVWKSLDLKTWKPLGAVWKIDQGTWQNVMHDGRRALWAPEIHYIKGTFWLTLCMNFEHGGTALLKSTSGKAEGPYVDVHPKNPLTDEIDASLFADDDGKVYWVYQNGKIARLKDDMTGLAEKPRLLVPWNNGQVGFEGAFITKINGRYVLICAEFNERQGQKAYDCMAATAKNLYGPYSPRYLAIPHGGHNMLFKDKTGQWWSTFFGSDPLAPFQERPAILKIEVDDEGHIRPQMP